MKKIYFALFTLLTVYSYAQSPYCNNVGFENGTTSNWTFKHANITGINLPCDICPDSLGAIATLVTATTSIGTQCANGMDLYGGFPALNPGGGMYGLLLNNDSAGGKMQQASFVITVSPATANFAYQFAVVLQKGGHVDSVAPYFSVTAYNQINNIISCTKYNTDTSTNITGWQTSLTDPSVSYLAWRTVTLDLSAVTGQSVKVVFTVSDCSQGSHFGYAYIDASCFSSQITANPALCTGSPATLIGPPGLATYSWTGPVTGNSQNLTTSTPGNYTLTTTSATGCPSFAAYYSLVLNPPPTVSYILNQYGPPHYWNAYPNYSAEVTNATWYWGDGTSTQGLYPSHTYSAAGIYNICATVYSSCGDSATYCQNDSIYRYSNNSTSSSMVYVNVVNGTTGINQLSNNNTIKIYPNPANNKITIDANDVVDIKLFDVLGKQITSTKQSQIDVSSLPNGVYFIQVQTSTGTTTQKIMVQH